MRERWSDQGNDRRGSGDAVRPLVHEPAFELLPWLVNGTLDGSQRRALEAHVATCTECAGELERCRALEEQVKATHVSPRPHPAQLAALLRRIDEQEQPGIGERLLRRWPQPFAGQPRFVRGALLAQAAAIVLLLGLAFWPAPGRYRTLSDAPGAAAAAPAGVHQVRVVFRPEASEGEIRRLLHDLQGEIVHGPSTIGAYTVAVPASGPQAEPLRLVLDHLRAHPSVRFAEPVATPAAP